MLKRPKPAAHYTSLTEQKTSQRRSLRVPAAEMVDALSKIGEIDLLSIDCFDTVIWRFVDVPSDLFYLMNDDPTFVRYGVTYKNRVNAEKSARQQNLVTRGYSEVTIEEIYAQLFPSDYDAIAALTQAEFALELQYSFAFPAAISLLRESCIRNIPVIVCSDTYFSSSQLTALLKAKLPADAMSVIKKVICSSEHRVSKLQGLLKKVRHGSNIKPNRIVHLGDNHAADFEAAEAQGYCAILIDQIPTAVASQQVMRKNAALIVDRSIGLHRPAPDLLKPYVALREIKPAKLICDGFTSLGPLMFGFTRWVSNEANRLKKSCDQVKLIYLLRDGYLPFRAMMASDLGQCLNIGTASISRFTAIGASFRRRDDVVDYLKNYLSAADPNRSVPLRVAARQLHLASLVDGQFLDDEHLLDYLSRSRNEYESFFRYVLSNSVIKKIILKSSESAERLKAHLERRIALKKGDHLCFVDLGYSGSAQRYVNKIANEWGIELHGRYLLYAEEGLRRQKSASGFLDVGKTDSRTLATLTRNVSLLETLCSSDEGSTLGYDDDGIVISERSTVTDQQKIVAAQVQSETIEFVEAAGRYDSVTLKITDTMLRDFATAELLRLACFPEKAELERFTAFELETGMGSDDRLKVYDAEATVKDLVRYGLGYSVISENQHRINRAYEQHAVGAELSLFQVMQDLSGLNFSLANSRYRSIHARCDLVRSQKIYTVNLRSYSTFDGWHFFVIPSHQELKEVRLTPNISDGGPIQLGRLVLCDKSALFTNREPTCSADAMARLSFFECDVYGDKRDIIKLRTPQSSISISCLASDSIPMPKYFKFHIRDLGGI